MSFWTVVIVEDDADLAEEIGFYLQRRGMTTVRCECAAALDAWLNQFAGVAVILLDLGLPDEDGISIAKRLSGRKDLRLVMLTARAMQNDRIEGFMAGADVYLTKPVDLLELATVVQRMGERLERPQTHWTLHVTTSTLSAPGGGQVLLSQLELVFLKALAENPEGLVTRNDLELLLWQRTDLSTARRLEVLVSRLRAKLEAVDSEGLIHSRRRGGYSLKMPLEKD